MSTAFDANNDRRERIIKVSRDITINSKRLIFLLHRISNQPSASLAKLRNGGAQKGELKEDETKPEEDVFQEARSKKQEIIQLLQKVSIELQGHDFYRHQRSIAPGMEEYIEAVSFLHYLETGGLITKQEIERDLVVKVEESATSTTPLFPEIPNDVYLGGIGDLTGELMRLTIHLAGKGDMNGVNELCEFVRNLVNAFQLLPPHLPAVGKKLDTMVASLKKIENGLYTLRVRTSEGIPMRPDSLMEDVMAME